MTDSSNPSKDVVKEEIEGEGHEEGGGAGGGTGGGTGGEGVVVSSNTGRGSSTSGNNSGTGTDEENNQDSSSNATPANAIEGGREINKRVLYVGGIDQNVTEDILKDLFKIAGEVVSIKILPDKNRRGFNYAFVEYENQNTAQLALETLNGKILNHNEIRINFAFQTQQAIKDAEFFNLFVGDLSNEINDELLGQNFAHYPSLVEARVMWDMTTGRSRGYGFVSFREEGDARNALETMDGKFIGSRPIRINWAQQKVGFQYGQPGGPGGGGGGGHQMYGGGSGNGYRGGGNSGGIGGVVGSGGVGGSNSSPGGGNNYRNNPGMVGQLSGPLTYDMVVNATANWQSTVYIGNLTPYTQPADILSILQSFGYIVDFKYQPERGYAFVKFDSHERAAMAIVQLSGFQMNGRILKCGWGKDRNYQPYRQY